ncbi:MAG: alcohol dehydrogenase catalytic domain-containing protein [Desulfobacterales bacterium]|nr:alcohol dehydrogenase catalytic domain-containing protein [Desulfobacterales bacterium]
MKVIKLIEPGRLEIQDAPVPVCPDDGVLVKVMACGICAADVKMFQKGHHALVYPRILGHEFTGIIEESTISAYKAGTRVQVFPGRTCGKCIQCIRGSDNKCEALEILGFNHDGGFAQYVAVSLNDKISGALNFLPDHVSFEAATLVEPVACCLNAQEKIRTQPGDTVLIIGAGPLGLMHGFVAKNRGAGTVLIAESDQNRRESAQMVADQNFNPEDSDFVEAVKTATQGKGVDSLIFACPQPLNEMYLNLMATGGKISLFSGLSASDKNIQIDLNRIHYRELLISGAYGCTARQNEDAIKLIAAGIIPAEQIISKKIKFEDIRNGFLQAADPGCLKVIVEVNYD